MVISGKHKGKISEITAFSKAKRRKNGTLLKAKGAGVLLKDVNIAKRAVKWQWFKDVPQPVDISNVMFYDEEKKVASKIIIVEIDGKRKRQVKKTWRIIE